MYAFAATHYPPVMKGDRVSQINDLVDEAASAYQSAYECRLPLVSSPSTPRSTPAAFIRSPSAAAQPCVLSARASAPGCRVTAASPVTRPGWPATTSPCTLTSFASPICCWLVRQGGKASQAEALNPCYGRESVVEVLRRCVLMLSSIARDGPLATDRVVEGRRGSRPSPTGLGLRTRHEVRVVLSVETRVGRPPWRPGAGAQPDPRRTVPLRLRYLPDWSAISVPRY